jgi:Ca2+-binding EF-hand superfamily protein
MNLKTSFITILALSVFGAGVAFAEHDDGREHRDMFKEADTNNDGKVSHDEFKAQHEKHMEEMFKKLDTNGDGFIDEAEKKAGHDRMREKFKEMRKNFKSDDAPPPSAQ